MNSYDQAQVEALFQQLVELPPDQRGAFLESNCDDPKLRAEVKKLLTYDELEGGGLTPVPDGGPDATAAHGRKIAHPGDSNPASKLPAGHEHRQFVPGEVLADRYRVVSILGMGGMGVIYEVADNELHRTLAMKVIYEPGDLERKSPSSWRPRFFEEAQVTAQLDHPGIVAVHDFGTAMNGQPFFTMKLVKGDEFARIVHLAKEKKNGWNLSRAIGVLVKVCQTIAYAHSKNVIHRDLKPANIMVGRFGEAYVMDWGLAKVIGKQDSHDLRFDPNVHQTLTEIRTLRREAPPSEELALITMDGSVVGTPAYMSLEQARGDLDAVDQLSDVYSIGAVLYHLLAGHAPYVEPDSKISPRTILARVLDSPPKRLSEIDLHIPPQLAAICEKAMNRNKQHRYQRAFDLAEDLQAWLDDRVVKAYRTGAFEEFKSWFIRNKTVALIAAICIAFVMLFVSGSALRERWRASKLQESLARQFLRRGQLLCEQGEIDRGMHWFVRGIEQTPARNQELRQVIYSNLEAWSRKWKMPELLFQHDAIVINFDFSPDGQVLVTTDTTGKLNFWSLESGEQIGEPLAGVGAVQFVTFSPDGQYIQTTNDGGATMLWHTKTRQQVGETIRHDFDRQTVEFSQDSRRLLIRSGSTAAIWNVADGRKLAEIKIPNGYVRFVKFSPRVDFILVGDDSGSLRLWNYESPSPHESHFTFPSEVVFANFNSDGRSVVAGYETGKIQVWDVATVSEVGPALDLRNPRMAEFDPSGDHLVIGSADGIVEVWDAPTHEHLNVSINLDDDLIDVGFTEDGKQIVTLTNGEARLWSASTGTQVGPALRLRNAKKIKWNEGTLGLAGSGNVATWSLRDESARFADSSREFPGGFSAKFVPDNRLLVSRWEYSQFHSLASNEPSSLESTGNTETAGNLFSHGGYMLWALEVSPDFQHVLTGAKDNTARLWLADSGEAVGQPLQHDDDVRCVTFSLDGMLAATGSFDGTARLWSVDTTRSIGKPLKHPNIVEDVCFSPDGRQLATASGDGGLRVWSVETGELVFPVHPIGASLLGVSYSPDGKLIAFCGRDGTARFLDASTGMETSHILQHPAWVEDIDFSFDGKILATASDNSVFLWSVSIGELLGPPLKTHDSPIYEVELDLKNDLVVGSTGSHHHLWKLPKIETAIEADPKTWVEVQTWSRMDDTGVMLRIKRENWLLLQQEFQRSSKRSQESLE